MMRNPIPSFAALLLAACSLWVPASVWAQDAAAGERKAQMCIGCHGIEGYQASFPEVYKVPRISGQNAKYIVAALTAYKKGDRRHPSMRAVSQSLSDKDMADLAAFYAQHGQSDLKAVSSVPETPVKAPSAEVAALLARGACASCHGASFNKPIDPSYPKLAGQHPDYLHFALRNYSMQGNPNMGRNNAIMGVQVKPYTRAELKALSEYIAALPGDLRTVQQSRFR